MLVFWSFNSERIFVMVSLAVGLNSLGMLTSTLSACSLGNRVSRNQCCLSCQLQSTRTMFCSIRGAFGFENIFHSLYTGCVATQAFFSTNKVISSTLTSLTLFQVRALLAVAADTYCCNAIFFSSFSASGSNVAFLTMAFAFLLDVELIRLSLEDFDLRYSLLAPALLSRPGGRHAG